MNEAVAEGAPAHQVTVVVADDHTLVREGIKALVTGVLGKVGFLEAGDGDSLFHAVGSNPTVRLALIDLNIPGMHGGLRLAEFSGRHPAISLVITAAMNSSDIMRRALNIPTVYALVSKSAGVGYVRAAIEAAMQRRKLPLAAANRGAAQSAVALTPRQEEIRSLLRQGMSNKAIAGILGISEGTVKNHITEIFRTLNATNRTQAAQFNFEAAVNPVSRSQRYGATMFDIDEYLHLARHASSAGQPHACMTYLKEVLQLQPENAAAIHLLAIQHAELGLFARAVSGFRTALRIEPGWEAARFQFGLLLLEGNLLAEAKEQFAALGGSSDQELRTCAEAMIAIAEHQPIVAREKLTAALSGKSANPALSSLMRRVLEKLADAQQPAAPPPDAQDNEIFLGAYRQKSS